MTDKAALDKLIEAVETGKVVTIPTPHRIRSLSYRETRARIMGYVEDYVVLRHKGEDPFIERRKDVLASLKAYRETLP